MTRTVHLAVRQALLEQRSFWRSAEYALFTFAFPLMILLLIGAANAGSHLPGTDIKNTTVFVPGILAFGVIVAAYVNLGSKVAVLRHDGVLKRIRTTPLPSAAYIGGLLVSTVATVMFITAATGLIGWLAFGAVPRPGELLALAGGLILGTVCFATLGLAISSVITSAESAGPSRMPASCRSRSSQAFSIHLQRAAGLAVTPGGYIPGQGARRGAAERLRGAPLPSLGPGQPGPLDRGWCHLRRLALPPGTAGLDPGPDGCAEFHGPAHRPQPVVGLAHRIRQQRPGRITPLTVGKPIRKVTTMSVRRLPASSPRSW